MDASHRMIRDTVELGVPQRDMFLDVSAAQTLGASVARVKATLTDTTGNYAITLPPVLEAAVRIVTIRVSITGTHTLTIQDQNDSVGWTDISLSTDGNYRVLYSDGEKWYVIASG